MTIRSLLVGLFLPIGATASLACGAQAPGSSTPDDVYTQTIVHFRPDGTSATALSTITASAQAELRAARLGRGTAPSVTDGDGGSAPSSGGITRDTTCADDGFWLYTNPDFSGSMLCFDGAGSASLSTYGWECTGGYCTQSQWAGIQSGAVGIADVDFGFSPLEQLRDYGVTSLTLGADAKSLP